MSKTRPISRDAIRYAVRLAIMATCCLSVGALLLAVFHVKQLAAAPPAMRWDRSFSVRPPGDTLAVPVRWSAACDVLGCPDQYRITWAIDYGALPNSDGVVAPSATRVLRDTVLTRTADTVRVAMPNIAQPATVCVYVVAVRRGLASDVRSACRTIETPDAAPPAVDSIKWDSLGVLDTYSALKDSLNPGTFHLIASAWSWVTITDSASGATRIDSVLVPQTRTTANGQLTLNPMRPDAIIQFCAVQAHAFERALIVLVPDSPTRTASQANEYVARCRIAAQTRAPNDSIRFLRAPLSWTTEVVPAATTRSG